MGVVTVDSKKLEYGPGAMYAGFTSSLGFEVGRQSYSNFLASAVCFAQAAVWVPTLRTQSPGRIQKVDPPEGSAIYTIGVLDSSWVFYFLDPAGGLGKE